MSAPTRPATDDPRWAAVDSYLGDLLAPPDDVLAATLKANADAGLPAIDVSPLQGKLLHILARGVGASKILEIGTLGGYSAIWLARALRAGGRLITLEADPGHAAVARANIERAGLTHVIDIRVGKAAETLPQLHAEGRGPFDFVFIDADKPGNPEYLKWSLRLSRPGTLVVCDNVVRGGAVAEADNTDANVQGARTFLTLAAAEPRLCATAIQTVGVKGHDGLAVAIIL
jgi:predicted O-methyltransferase YrrM